MNNKYKDITGQRFNKLTATRFLYSKRNQGFFWEFLCDCGNKKILRAFNVVKGLSKSCGCIRKKIRETHKMSTSRTYRTWAAMKNRCTNKNNPAYKSYGGRGIKIQENWLEFESFYKDMGDRPNNMTLDRIDNNGNYCKENCHWALRKTQSRNTRRNRIINYNGKFLCIAELAEIKNIKYNVLFYRLNAGWPVEKLFCEIKKE